jgi:hypothetical protein
VGIVEGTCGLGGKKKSTEVGIISNYNYLPMRSLKLSLESRPRRGKCHVCLYATFNTLNKTKNQSQNQNQNSNPEGVPLDAISAITPPLSNGCWLCFVEQLFKNDEPITPEGELFNVSINSSKSMARCCSVIEFHCR